MPLVKLKDNLFVPKDFENSHHYYADEKGEKEYTGITTIIGVLAKPALIGWAARMAVDDLKEPVRDIMQKLASGKMLYEVAEGLMGSYYERARTAHTKKKEAAGTHGTDAHSLVEQYINICLEQYGGKPALIPINGEQFGSIKKFTDWACENVDRFLFSERRMANAELFIAGTADFAYVGKDGKKYMADFKTSSGIYGIDYFLQVAAYRMLAEAEGDEPYDGATIVRLGKDGKFEVQHRYAYETDKEAFLACLTLYRAQATYKAPSQARRHKRL